MSAGNGRTELCDYEHEMSVLSQLDDAEKTIEALQQENEQLQAQVAELRDSLKWLKSISFSHEDNLEQWPSQETREPIEHALSNSMGVDYHNPADMAALKQARKALTIVSDYYSNVLNMAAWKTVKEALAVIDKMGGREDV